MQEIEEEVIGSQSEDSEQHDNDESVNAALEAFGIEQEESVNDDPPAKEEVKTEPKMLKVKHNKEEIEVDVSDDKIPEYVQRSLALDKERERSAKNDKLLKEAATLLGLESLDEATIQRVRQERALQQQRQEQNQYNQLRNELRQEAEDAGLDPDRLEAYLNNHPLMKQAQSAIAEKQQAEVERSAQEQKKQHESNWQELFSAYPETAADSHAWKNGETPTFFTDEMKAMVERGYAPKDAFELAHRDKIQTQTKKMTEQRVIKEQHLGLRSKVETVSTADNEPQVSAELASAFAAFGLPADSAKKYAKK